MSVINGVSLLTKAGKPKSKYSPAERLKIMGARESDLRAFVQLFCPGMPLYAATKGQNDNPRDWTTPGVRLKDEEVLKHLIGNLTAPLFPKWIAPRSWEVARWVGIDVDYRGDQQDFDRRKRFVIGFLKRMKIPRRGVLVSITPSGGRHYRFFLTRKVRVLEILRIMEHAGLVEKAGQIEIFPSMKKGLRLPFGYLPGQTHNPQQWVRFIRNYRRGRIPKVDWQVFAKRARRVAQKREFAQVDRSKTAEPFLGSSIPKIPKLSDLNQRPILHGIPKSMKAAKTAETGLAKPTELADTPYDNLMSKKVESAAEVMHLYQLGIQRFGTRVEATKRLAFHFLFVKRLPPEQVKRDLIDWVYRTGAETSKDVISDNKKGTRRVEGQTKAFVDWLVKNHRESSQPPRVPNSFSIEELRSIKRFTSPVSHVEHIESTALNFLQFAKRYGKEHKEGWEVQIAVRGVIRKWLGCARMQYKPKIEALKSCGMIEMIREKKQTPNKTGRARTYLVRIDPRLGDRPTIPNSLALKELGAIDCSDETGSVVVEEPRKNLDTYGKSISSPLKYPKGKEELEPKEVEQEKIVGQANYKIDIELKSATGSISDLAETMKRRCQAKAEIRRLSDAGELTGQNMTDLVERVIAKFADDVSIAGREPPPLKILVDCRSQPPCGPPTPLGANVASKADQPHVPTYRQIRPKWESQKILDDTPPLDRIPLADIVELRRRGDRRLQFGEGEPEAPLQSLSPATTALVDDLRLRSELKLRSRQLRAKASESPSTPMEPIPRSLIDEAWARRHHLLQTRQCESMAPDHERQRHNLKTE